MTRLGADSPYIVRAPRLRADRDARAIVAEAERQAEQLREAAEAESIQRRTEAEAEASAALEEARSQGREAAAAEAAALMAQAAGALDLFWREREAELRDLAFAIAQRVLSALPRDELILRLATEAIAEHARDAKLALKASPDTAERLRAALGGLAFGDRVAVMPDPSLGPGDCTLLHPQGRTDVGLVAQFRSMMSAERGGGGQR